MTVSPPSNFEDNSLSSVLENTHTHTHYCYIYIYIFDIYQCVFVFVVVICFVFVGFFSVVLLCGGFVVFCWLGCFLCVLFVCLLLFFMVVGGGVVKTA